MFLFLFFFFNCVKVLEMYRLLTIFRKQNHLSYITEVGIDRKWDKVFFNLFSYHFMILVQEPEVFFFISCDSSHLLSQHEHEAQLVPCDWGQWEDCSASLSE